METTLDAPSVFEIVAVIAVGIVLVTSGVQSKWKYISQVKRSHFDDPWVHVRGPEIKGRVRRLAILYVICMLGMALALTIMILSRSTVLFVIALIFAVVGVFAHIFIDLDTSKR